jgi:secondary thiamine-phosphate synthase enzyme
VKTFSIYSQRKNEMLDITQQIREIVQGEGVFSGLCVVFVPHTTAGVTVNENADPDVQRDMVLGLTEMIPKENYKHFEHNSPRICCLRSLAVRRLFSLKMESCFGGGRPSISASLTDLKRSQDTGFGKNRK